MGTTASTHKTTVVKSISIDQNAWNRPSSNHRRNSAASHRSLPMLSNFIRKKSSCDGLTKAERLRLIDRAIRSESAALECEEKMKGLEREIRKLELRNHDLSTEVCWLRQQCTIASPDVPNGTITTCVPSKCTEQCQKETKILKDTVAKQNADLSGLRMKVEQMTTVDMRKEIRISELTKELDAANSRISALENLCRNQIGSVIPRSASPFMEAIEEQETTNTESETRDESQQKKHSEENGEKTAEKKLANKNLIYSTRNPRPSLRNIFVMDNDRQIDGKVRPSTAFESRPTKHSMLERGESFPVLKSMQVLRRIPPTLKSEESTDKHRDDQPCGENKKIVDDSQSDDSDIDVTDILETSYKPTARV